MTVQVSPGHSLQMLAVGSAKKIYTGGKIEVYSAPVAPTAGGAATGTKLYTLTRNGLTVKAKQKIRFTPTPGTANAAEWNITLFGVKFTFIDDGTATPAEICTGLYNLIRAAIGTTSITTPAGKLNIPDIFGAFTLTDNATSLDVEAAVAGVPFTYAASVSGAGAGTGAWTTAELVADAYGLQFEDSTGVSAGELELLAGLALAGACVANGNPAYFRLVTDGDDGSQSSTLPRVQGLISVAAGGDAQISNSAVAIGQIINVSTFKLRVPIS